MAKGKKKGDPKGKKITLKMAKNSIKITFDGKRRLSLSNMGITTFPKCILKLADVEELDLSRNMIKKLPESIEKFQKLRWLDIHSNYLEKLPETIGQLQNLLYLNLCNNKLNASSLPMEIGQLENLRYLNLGMNNFETLPSCLAGLKELQELGLFDNKLTDLPENIAKLPKLNKMNVMRNPFPEPEGDEDPIDKIKRTESLYLVHEQELCESCLNVCQEKRAKLTTLKNSVSSQRRSKYGGLVTPNSTAKETQDEWR